MTPTPSPQTEDRLIVPAYLETRTQAVMACMERMSRREAAQLAVLARCGVEPDQHTSDSLVGLGCLVPRNKSRTYNELSPLGAECVRFMGFRTVAPISAARIAELQGAVDAQTMD